MFRYEFIMIKKALLVFVYDSMKSKAVLVLLQIVSSDPVKLNFFGKETLHLFDRAFQKQEKIYNFVYSILQKDVCERRYLRSILRNESICDQFGKKNIISEEGFAKRRYLRSVLRKKGSILQRDACERRYL